MLKVIEIAGLLFSLFRAEDDSKLDLVTKMLILTIVGLLSISGYVILEYRVVFEKALEYKYKSIYLETQIEHLQNEVFRLKDKVRIAEETSVVPTMPSNSSYEHPVPTTPNIPKRKPMDVINREWADDLVEKING